MNMNRTGDLYMNRITFAVKSALGLILLAPPALVQPAAAPNTSLDEIVVTGIRKSEEQSIASKRASSELVEVVSAEALASFRQCAGAGPHRGRPEHSGLSDYIFQLPVQLQHHLTPDQSAALREHLLKQLQDSPRRG
jgi:hypothetical protein